MGFESFVGLRYLMAKRERNVLSVITLISIGGVAVGVMALIVVLSVMGGFEGDLREKIIGAKAHIVISATSGYLEGWAPIVEEVKSIPGVIGVSPYVEGEVMVNSSANLQGVLLRGVNPELVKGASDLSQNMEEGRIEFLSHPYAVKVQRTVRPPQDEDGPGGFILQRDPHDPAPSEREKEEMKASGARASMAFTGADHGHFADDFFEGKEPSGAIKILLNEKDSKPAEVASAKEIEEEEEEMKGLPEGELEELPKTASDPRPDVWREGGRSRRSMGKTPGGGATLGPPSTGRSMKPVPGLEPDSNRKRHVAGLIIGRELKENLAVYVGHEVNVMSPMGDVGPTGGIPKSRPFRVVGVFFSGMYEYDTKFAYTTLEDAQRFFNLGDRITGIEIKVEDMEQSGAIKADIEAALGDLEGVEVRDWRELNGSLFSALMLEKIAMFIILTFIILVASFNIICLLIMIVIEKAKEIAILKSMGASDLSVMGVFIIQGLVIGVLGTLLGACAGLGLCWAIAGWGIELPADVYYLSHVPVEVRPYEVLFICGSAVAISLLATIPPSILAARLDPVEGLRYQ